MSMSENFNYIVEQFADLQLLRYRVAGFENLSLRQKELIYYLSEAALEGRDILLIRTESIIYRFENCWRRFMCLIQATVIIRNFRDWRFI